MVHRRGEGEGGGGEEVVLIKSSKPHLACGESDIIYAVCIISIYASVRHWAMAVTALQIESKRFRRDVQRRYATGGARCATWNVCVNL